MLWFVGAVLFDLDNLGWFVFVVYWVLVDTFVLIVLLTGLLV